MKEFEISGRFYTTIKEMMIATGSTRMTVQKWIDKYAVDILTFSNFHLYDIESANKVVQTIIYNRLKKNSK